MAYGNLAFLYIPIGAAFYSFAIYSWCLIQAFCKCVEKCWLTSNISSRLHSGENLASFVLMSEILISSQPQQKCLKI